MGNIIAVVNQKGGVGKTTTTTALADILNRAGQKVLLVDMDPQNSLTVSTGIERPDKLQKTMKDVLISATDGDETDISPLLHLDNGIDIIPTNIDLAGVEMALVNAFQREQILKVVLDQLKANYDYIIIDSSPSLGLLTINCLVAANEVIVPVQAHFLGIRGMEQLFKSIQLAKRVNSQLNIAGVLFTMVDDRSKEAKAVMTDLKEAYGKYVGIFNTVIPMQVKTYEAPREGMSITEYDPDGAAAVAYREFVREYLDLEV